MASIQGDNVPGSNENHGDIPLDPDAVVITGISTVMPGSHNIMEFADNLYNKVNMVKCGKHRWNYKYPGLPQHHGTIPQVDRFDAQFFMVHQKLSHIVDAMTRKLLEQSYQAVYDAGICPTDLSDKPVGVFVAAGPGESEKCCAFAELHLGIVACNRAMAANRISYYLNLKGPSIHFDSDAAGTAVALEKAHASIISGQCESAIVGGARVLLFPQTALRYHQVVPANCDVKSYDMNADGQSISEGVTVIFLQKYKDAKRVYASIRHVKTGYTGFTDISQKIFLYGNTEIWTNFLREFYKEAKVSPSKVDYVEGCGSAILEADKAELESIDSIFCKDRANPLAVGSVTSNVGHMDALSCITGLIKMVLAYQKGTIAANINYKTPRQDVAGVRDGRLHVLTEEHHLRPKFAAVNTYSNTGVSGHVLLQRHFKPKNLSQYNSNLPYLMLISGRQESAVQKIIDDIKERPLDVEELALLNNIHKTRIPKHLARGFAVYSTNDNKETLALKEQVDYFDETKRPLWFVYSGMGSQWVGMGAQLMRISIFAAAIDRCHKVLEPKGVDLINIITASDKTLFDNILNSFVGIAAVQIGLTDVLRAVGLVPDNIIGHSVGELGCAYADGCVTAEEMMLMAYSRGLVSLQTPFIRGSMAAVGIGYKQIIKMVPPEIEVACHNGPESSTISGPADVMKEFVATLSAQGVFAKEVPCSNIAYHSKYIAEAGPGLLKYLKEVIKTTRPRSAKWISTSVPQERWNEPLAKYSSAEYHTNNLLSPVLMEETLSLVPPNAVLVEIAPHGLLQAILKRSLPDGCRNIQLTRRGHEDNVLILLEAIGKLYMEGFDFDTSYLYPPIEFPVSTETRPLSHLIEWMYSEKRKMCQYMVLNKRTHFTYKPIISIYDEEYEYLSGNIIDGRREFPFANALVLVWDTLAMFTGKKRAQMSVQFKDIAFHVQPRLADDQCLRLTVTIQRGSGRFEVFYEHGIVAEGFVTPTTTFSDLPKILECNNDPLELAHDDIYKLLHTRGYQYKHDFRSIQKTNMSFTVARIIWNDNWATLIDGIFQLNILRQEHDGISYPQYINRLSIDVSDHMSGSEKKDAFINAVFFETHNMTKCGGLVVEHINFKNKLCSLRQTCALKELKFIPFNHEENIDVATSFYVYLQIIAENLNKNVLNVLHIQNSVNSCILEQIKSFLNGLPEIKLNVVPVKRNEIKNLKQDCTTIDFVLLHDMFLDKGIAEDLFKILPNNIFIINLEDDTKTLYPTSIYRVICSAGNQKERITLAKWRPTKTVQSTAALSVRNSADLDHLKATHAVLSRNHNLFILTSYPPPSGLKDFVQQWRLESRNNNIYVIMTSSNYADIDNLDFSSFVLVFNIFDSGIWGGEYYIPLEESNYSGSNMSLQIAQFGDLNSLEWVEAIVPSKDGIPVKVHFAGLNVYDAKRATAEISIKDSSNHKFGMDFSGVTESGDRVMGLIKTGAASGKVVAQPELLWPVPEHWSLEDAATVPLPYCLAFYCLVFKSKLMPHFNILVNGGTGALGQAIISICLHHKCNVFATVSDVHKKRFLCKLFPSLPASHIGNSRDTTFRNMVMEQTKREGCQIIIISSNDIELKQASLNCSALDAVTIDTVQMVTQEHFNYGMNNMARSNTYVLMDFPSIFTYNNKKDMKRLQLMVSEGIARGYVRPLSRVVYHTQEVPRALRLLVTSRHRGRVLLNLEEAAPAVIPRITCAPNACHLVLCEDGFGLHFVERLVKNGVRKIYVHCSPSSYLEYKKRFWQKLGAHIQMSSDKLHNKDQAIFFLKNCMRWAPVEGVFIVKTSSDGLGSTDIGSRNLASDLDLASKELDLKLKYFAVIHEESLGNEICLKRSQNGQRLLSLQLQNLKKYDECDCPSTTLQWDIALDAIEKAVHTNKPIVVAHAEISKQRDIIEEVARILGVNIDKNTPEHTTLEEIGMKQGKDEELCNFLDEKFAIRTSKDTVRQITIAKLKELQESTKVTEECATTGLNTYLNYIDSDELLANCNIVLIPTLVNTSELRPDEFDNELSYLCIVPGIEGHHQRFRKLCERLKVSALILQPGFDNTDRTIEEMAQRLANVMIEKLVLKKNFYILGYELGILVAIEIAAILEKRGLTGTIYCLGGTVEDMCATFTAQFGNIDTEQLQNEIIEQIYALITKNKTLNLKELIMSGKDLTEKINIFMKVVHDHCSYSKEYVKSVIKVIHDRYMMARNYICKQNTLKSKIVILKAKLPIPSTDLSNYHMAHELNATLTNSLEDLRCAAVINKYLDSEILDEYNKSNHCETSLPGDNEQFAFGYLEDD